MADENAVLMYKGRPLMRKDNLIYYGSMADSHIVMLQVLETKKMGDMDIATRVSVQLVPGCGRTEGRMGVNKGGEQEIGTVSVAIFEKFHASIPYPLGGMVLGGQL